MIALFVISCGAISAENGIERFSGQKCFQINSGNLKVAQEYINEAVNKSPAANSFYLECALMVYIGEPNGKASEYNERRQAKQKIVELLLQQRIDVNYKSEYSETLLIAAVNSYLDSKWRVGVIRELIAMGVDIGKKNEHGFTALDLAKQRGDKDIIKSLSGH